MVPHNYKQLAVFENDLYRSNWVLDRNKIMVRYIEIDNFIVHPEHRSKD
jgi:hypothetical protein